MNAPQTPGIELARLTWLAAQAALNAETVVVIPLGAATKEHGPHLPLNTDWLQAEYYGRRVLEVAKVVVVPTLGYSHYPAFVEYPGSVSLSHDTARDTVVDICRSLARHGARRFYVINIGISTKRPLQAAARLLEAQGLALHYTDLAVERPVRAAIQREQEGGSHADLVETSAMLYIAPEVVDMRKAVKDFHTERDSGGLTRDPGGTGVYSASGIYGDPTGATHAKGRELVEELLQCILDDIEALGKTPLPEPPAASISSACR